MGIRLTVSFRVFAVLMAQFTFVSAGFAVDLYDAVADFSNVTNTNASVWSYRYRAGSTRDGNYPLLPDYGPSYGTWNPAAPGAWSVASDNPQVGVNQTGSDAVYAAGPPFVWPNGVMMVHPGVASMAVVSWLSPSAGTATIQFAFSSMDTNGGDGISWYVERNDENTTLASGTYGDGGSSGFVTIEDVVLNPGDRINFIIGPRADYHFDSTQLIAAISTVPVPEPSTYILCSLAGLLTAALRRRS